MSANCGVHLFGGVPKVSKGSVRDDEISIIYVMSYDQTKVAAGSFSLMTI